MRTILRTPWRATIRTALRIAVAGVGAGIARALRVNAAVTGTLVRATVVRTLSRSGMTAMLSRLRSSIALVTILARLL